MYQVRDLADDCIKAVFKKLLVIVIIIIIIIINEVKVIKCDQTKMTKMNEWITKLELEKIRSKVLQKEKHIEVNNNDNTGERFCQDEENVTRTKLLRLIRRI